MSCKFSPNNWKTPKMTLFLSHIFAIATQKCIGLPNEAAKQSQLGFIVHTYILWTSLPCLLSQPLPNPSPESFARPIISGGGWEWGVSFLGGALIWPCEWSEVAIARPTFGAAKRCRLEWMVQATIVKYVAILCNKSFHMGVSYWRVHGTVVKCAQIVWNNLFYM